MRKVVQSNGFDLVSYVLLTLVFVVGFVAYLQFKYNPTTQFLVVLAALCAYLGWGLVYHHLKRDLVLRVYLEYLLIASIVFVCALLVFWR
jgi:hypothetical protein